MQQSLADEAMALVGRLEESGALGAGGRLPALLRYLVQEELAGRGDRLKAYSIATEVLGRGQAFDPQQDSIVRVEIGRLRKALDLFYATQGRDESIRIAIPRGASRPKISVGDPTPRPEEGAEAETVPPPEEAPGRRRLPVALASTILVLAICLSVFFLFGRGPRRPVAFAGAVPRLILLPVQTEGADPELRALALGLRSQLAAELGQQKWLTVSLLDGLTPPPPTEPKLFAATPVLIKDANSYVLSAQLTSEPDHIVRWSGQYRNARLHGPLFDLASDLAAQLARDLGYPLGPIGQAVAGRSSATDAEVEDRFFCMMNAYRYWRDLEPKQAADAQACLTRLTARAPDFSEGRAALALITIEQGRKFDGEDRKAAFASAAALLRGAPDDDRLSLLARMALSACSGEVETTKALARSVEAAAPNDPDSLAAAAYAAGFAALDWPFALEAEAKALKLARDPKPIYSQVSAAKALMEGDYEGALRAISRTTQQGHALGQTMLLIIAQAANAPVRAEGAATALAKLRVGDAEALKTTISRACWRPELKRAFETALSRAPALDAPPR
jgi:hypothetical protein